MKLQKPNIARIKPHRINPESLRCAIRELRERDEPFRAATLQWALDQQEREGIAPAVDLEREVL